MVTDLLLEGVSTKEMPSIGNKKSHEVHRKDQRNAAYTAQRIAGSSEALLSGQKPPFRLLVRAMNASDNSRATHIKFAVSDAFVVSFGRSPARQSP